MDACDLVCVHGTLVGNTVTTDTDPPREYPVSAFEGTPITGWFELAPSELGEWWWLYRWFSDSPGSIVNF